MIEIKNLSKSYGSNDVLKEINLQFKPANAYGIVGNNGAGKTTLFRCLAGFENYSGEISPSYYELKNQMGFLPTDPYFFPKITGKEYLQLLCNAREVTIPNFESVNIFELPLSQYAENYSTGMKKKLALTAILLQKNEVFILDEPFNGVDLHSNMMISEIINRLKEKGKTLLISSHIFSTLTQTCDCLHLLDNGIISKTVSKPDFDSLENEMKSLSISDKLSKLDL